jgi:hypothetical protein
MSCLAYRRQIEGEVVGGAEGVGVIGAEDVAAALQGVLVQVADRLCLAKRASWVRRRCSVRNWPGWAG